MTTEPQQLSTRISQELDLELLDFLNTYADSFVKWELLRFFYKNPNTMDTAESLARYIGRTIQDIQTELSELEAKGLLKQTTTGNFVVYTLEPRPELQARYEKFIQATDNREFLRKAIYHLVR
jgi:DNA-binding MarR family transcriptional regulator